LQLRSETWVRATTEQVSADLKDEAIVLGMRRGLYYGLDPVGAHVWNQIQEPRRIEDVALNVVGEFSVDEERARADVLSFLNRLLDEGLIEIVERSR
jgi:hypothetical protein